MHDLWLAGARRVANQWGPPRIKKIGYFFYPDS
jgi:hypothetical protein